jgi:dienelactone hydrolase
MKAAAMFLAACLSSAGFAAEPVRIVIPSQDGQLQIPGYWFEAPGAEPRPAVIGLHGCGGAFDSRGRLVPGWYRDSNYLDSQQMHLLVLDSFTPRGLKSICEIPNARRTLDEEDRRDDVFAAIRWLAQEPRVDKSRIALLGRSHGGQTVLSVLDRTAAAVNSQPIQPRAAIALYPGCSKYLRMIRYELSAPLLVMIGELDDWTPAARCVDLKEKVIRAQEDAKFELIVFPGSYHGFDGIAPVRVRENLGNTKSGKATVGGNPEAREQAQVKALEFLSRTLDVPLQPLGTRPIR